MPFDPRFILALAILVAVSGMVVRALLGTLLRRGESGQSATGRLAKMEERITRIEEATSGLVAEFVAVRERERFMTQLVESRARKDARPVPALPDSSAASTTDSSEGPSPFVVQTVLAARRATNTGA